MRRKEFLVYGMHCPSCELLVERRLRKIPFVHKAQVDITTGKALITYKGALSPEDIEKAFEGTEYSLTPKEEEFAEIGLYFFLFIVAYIFLKQYSLLPEFNLSATVGLGLAVIIGIVASLSTCMAVTGGLLLAMTARYLERFPTLTWGQKLFPHVYFNIGRLLSYALFGALTGYLGSFLALTSALASGLVVLVSLIMITLGAQLLFPRFTFIRLTLPKNIARRMMDSSGVPHPLMPFALGASTFFFPCGFTQGLQLYVLGKGEPLLGALTMFFFALGTFPGLACVGFLSTFIKAQVKHHLFKAAAVLIILLGVSNLAGGLAPIIPTDSGQTKYTQATLKDGEQQIFMEVRGLEYVPSRFEVRQGIPVRWTIDASKASGCAHSFLVPGLGIREYLPSSTTTVRFTPAQTGTFPFHCSMQMTTAGAELRVVP